MKRIFYIIAALICTACSLELFPDENIPNYVQSGFSSEIAPSAYVNKTDLPPAATKAMINVSTVASMEANVLRIDENRNPNTDEGLYTFGSWESAYLAEATVASPEDITWLRSMTLNPVQAYSYKVNDSMGDELKDTTFYHTRMISWYPRTCTLYKDEEGKAPVMRFSDFHTVDQSVYTVDSETGKVAINFKGLDGTKDVMVSNIVEGQHWHSYNAAEVNNSGTNIYTYPFGQNESSPTYLNYMTYKHYLSAVKIYAYADESNQVTSMWGAIRKVIMRNQPSEVSVTLPSPSEMGDATIAGNVQTNAMDYGTPTFSGSVDFPLIKTAMFDSETNDTEDPEIAEDNPHLVQGKRIYLGYAMIKPNMVDGQHLEFDVHTDAGVLCLSVPMTTNVTTTVDGVTTTELKECFQPGYFYTVDVKFNTEGAVADIVMESGEDHYFDLSTGKELANGEHAYHYANCYVIHPEIKRSLGEGETNFAYYDGYAFLATMIGSATSKIYPEFASDRTSKMIDPVRAGLLWESSPGLVTHVEFMYGYVRFKVQPPQIKEGGVWKENPAYKEGNAVIAVYDSQRKVLWSWHIWITDEPQDVKYTIGSGKTFTLLDRNLGATSATTSAGSLLETYGLYYQWGRKDPSMGPPDTHYRPQSTATMYYYDYYGTAWNSAGVVTMDRPGIRDGVEHPMYLILPTDFSMTTYQYDWMYTDVDNLWGDYKEKTIYDPCPFDYMVPQDEISTLFASNSPTHLSGQGMTIDGVVNGSQLFTSFFPFAGYKGVDKGVSSLSSAWRYVGAKGDYMSAKIEQNGHRSRTYISDAYSWTEYGADADNDGDGDASRTYNSRVNADDMANRRTAASVRCVKMNYGLPASLNASFVGDRKYAFVGDGKITFDYSVIAEGDDISITSAHIDLNGNESSPIATITAGGTSLSGSRSFDVPSEIGEGLARYRLVTKGSNGIISRVSHVLRLFEISNLVIDGKSYSSDLAFDQGKQYSASFTLTGIKSDFTVLINGVEATRGNTGSDESQCVAMPYSVANMNISGHIHIQINDADGNLACEKSYPVKMNMATKYILGDKITNVNQLVGAGLYTIRESGSYYKYCFEYDKSTGKLSFVSYNSGETEIKPERVFAYHRADELNTNGDSAKSYGAWYSPSAGGFLNEDFGFGAEADAVYTVCTKMQNALVLLKNNTSEYLYFDNSFVPGWYVYGYIYHGKWDIYKVTAQ